MAPEPTDPLLGAVILLLAIASVGAWFFLYDRMSQGPILPFEPRRPVPWHGIWIFLPVVMVLMTLAGALSAGGTAEKGDSGLSDDIVEQIAQGSVLQTTLVLIYLVGVAISSKATRADLGLPRDPSELARDIRIGFIAWLASIAPVYGVQLLLLLFLGPAEGHMLLNVVEEQPGPLTFIIAFFVAVVLAPLCEEPLFRLVLQGWLEKWDLWSNGYAVLPRPVKVVVAADHDESAPIAECFSETSKQESMIVLPAVGVVGLPYGWMPILISSLLFGLAHFGYGPEPIPMFMFGLILGYVYQRTRRILPSIVAHALFNGMTLFMLWRVTSAGAP